MEQNGENQASTPSISSSLDNQIPDHLTSTERYGNIDDYFIVERIGRGKYSTVFLGCTIDNKPCVLKVLKPVSLQKIKKEIMILEELKGGPNVCELYDVVIDTESQSVTLVTEYIEAIDFRILYEQLKINDIKFYLYNILKCLEYSHSKNIMHRDIKPQNIMIDNNRREVRIIDWGLAERYIPNTPYHVRVATIHYKSPEILLNNQFYDLSVDIWGLGCTFAAMIFKRIPFFRGRDNNEMIYRIGSILGRDKLIEYGQKFKLEIPQQVLTSLADHKPKSWEKLKNDKNEDVLDPLGLDLLWKMLVIDHTQRITASEALQHPFFDEVRDTAIQS